MQCRLCGENLTLGYFSKTWNDPHYRTYHPQYSNWVGGWIKNFVLIGTVDLVLLGSVLYLLHGLSTLLGEVAILLYLFPLYILMILFVRKSSQFKREWREQHPSLTA